MSDQETLGFYDSAAADYASRFGAGKADKDLQTFMDAVAPGGLILDFGCGPGKSAALMKKTGANSWDQFVLQDKDCARLIAQIPPQEWPLSQAENHALLGWPLQSQILARARRLLRCSAPHCHWQCKSAHPRNQALGVVVSETPSVEGYCRLR